MNALPPTRRIEAVPLPRETQAAPLAVAALDPSALDAIDWPRAYDLGAWSGFVFQTREFLRLWIDTIGAGRGSDSRLVVVSDRFGSPLMFLPLCIERRYGFSLLRFMDGGVADHNAPLLRPGWEPDRAAFLPLWERILAALPRVDGIELRKIAAFAGATPNPLMHLPGLRVDGATRAIAIDQTFAEFVAEPRRKRYRGVSRRKLRALQRQGVVTFATVTETAEAKRVAAFLFEHKRKQYLRTLRRDVFALPGYAAFFERIAAPPFLNGVGHLSCLTCGRDLVAAHLGYRSGGRFYQIMPAYDAERFANASGGRLLLEHLIEESFRAGDRVFDFGEGAEAYKEVWATEAQPLYACSRGRTLPGRMALWLNESRRRATKERS
jgi:CelD/BcsL family acetyltransferase involved in cellulose biosynthesis